jgi:hypothetical protein
MKTWIGRLALLVVFALVGCGGGGGGDSSTNPTIVVEGRVLNGVLVGSTVEVFGANGGSALGTATTDANGRFSVRVSQQGPYRLRAHGGKLNGADYTGILEAACSGGSICLVTPHSTVLSRLVDEHGFNPGDAAGHLANSLGFAADPFAGGRSGRGILISLLHARRLREAMDLAAWVAGVVAWSTGENTEPPAGVGGSGPADPPPQPDPDPAPPPQPDPDPDPEPIPDPEPDPVVPVTHTVSTAAGAGGTLAHPAKRSITGRPRLSR